MNDIIIEVEGGKSVRCKTANKVCKGDIIVKAKSNDDLYRQLIEGPISGEFIIPEGITTLRNYAFAGCKETTKFVLPTTLETIGEYCFNSSNGLGKQELPEGLTTIGARAFASSDLVEVVIPSTLKTVLGNAFASATALETVIIRNGVERLESLSFNSCTNLKTVWLPNSLVNHSGGAPFYGCSNVEVITLEQGFSGDNYNFSQSTKYSVEVLVAMFEALTDLTGQTAKTLTVGATNLAKLSEEQKQIATNKNWILK